MRQVFLYGIIGGFSALTDFLLFTFLYKTLGLNEFLANTISVHAGIVMSFLLNRKYNFKKTDHTLYRALIFYLVGLFGLALSQGILWLGGEFDMPVLWVKIISIFFVAAVQFIINKFITFKN